MTFYLNLFKDAVAKFLFFSVKFIAFLTASSDVIFIGSLEIKCLEVKQLRDQTRSNPFKLCLNILQAVKEQIQLLSWEPKLLCQFVCPKSLWILLLQYIQYIIVVWQYKKCKQRGSYRLKKLFGVKYQAGAGVRRYQSVSMNRKVEYR